MFMKNAPRLYPPQMKSQVLPLFIQVLTGLFAVTIVLGGYYYVREDRTANVAEVGSQLNAMAGIAADDVARALFGARDSIRLLSRMSAMRDCTRAGWVSPFLSVFRSQTDEIAGALESYLEDGRRQVGSFRSDLALGLDLFMAGIRRFFYDQGFLEACNPWLSKVEAAAAWFVGIRGSLAPPSEDGSNFDSASNLNWARSGPGLAAAIRDSLEFPFRVAEPVFSLIDKIFSRGPTTVSDPREVERLLAVSLSDRDLIRTVTVRSLAGKKIVSATEIGDEFDFLTGWIGRVARAGRSFYCGPVFFDEGLGRPLWQMAVPLRDREREPFAMLTARVDLDFLGDLTEKARFGQTAYLMIVDEDGVIIGHPRHGMVVNQVNASKANPAVSAVLKGEEGIDELRLGGIPYLVAYRQLKKIDEHNLPGWGVLVLAPVSEMLPSPGKAIFLALAVAAVALFILLYVSTMILALVEENSGG